MTIVWHRPLYSAVSCLMLFEANLNFVKGKVKLKKEYIYIEWNRRNCSSQDYSNQNNGLEEAIFFATCLEVYTCGQRFKAQEKIGT